jgi:hypothetical protein
MTKYTITEERNGYALVELDSDTSRCTVIRIDRDRGQVYSAMPTDLPRGGGLWFARISDCGIDYVAKLYSRSYARRMFKVLAADAEEMALPELDADELEVAKQIGRDLDDAEYGPYPA